MEEFDLKYQSALRDGKAMVAVAVDGDEEAAAARQLLEKESPEGIDMLDARGEKVDE
jgi:hypothetical protein